MITHSQFCPKCAHPLRYESGDLSICAACNFHHYDAPRPTSAAIIVNKNGHILMVKRAIEPQKGLWDLPGGFVESKESAEESVIRELKEELGVDIRRESIRYFASYPDDYAYDGMQYQIFGLTFIVEVPEDTTFTPDDDVSEARFFAPEEAPLDAIAFSSMKQSVLDYMAQSGTLAK